MEKQRHVQERMDHKTIDTVPKLKTFLKIERHAFNVYTRFLFELVQKEIFVGLWHCHIYSKSLVEGSKDKVEEDDPVDLFFKKDRLYKNVVDENFANEATSIVDYCVHLLSKDEPRLGAFVEKLKSLKKDVEADCPNPPSKNKTDNLEQLVGVSKPPVVEVNNPTIGSNKGRKKLCIKGGKEKAIEKSLKGRNSCSLCGGIDHNKRTCLGRFKVEDEVVLQNKCIKRKLWLKRSVSRGSY
nr:protein FAR1-related sequence 5 [Tanacetum cinerariifolium]